MIRIEEKSHVIELLKETLKAINQEDIIKLKDLSNQTIHSASIYQDMDNIIVAVVIYSVSKIIERSNYRDYPQWKPFIQSLKSHLEHAHNALEKDDLSRFRFEIKKIRKAISKLSGNFKYHIQDVFRKAEINKASRIYEHGISMAQTSKLLGVSIWELAEYAGNTGIGEVDLNKTLSEKKRVEIAMNMFK